MTDSTAQKNTLRNPKRGQEAMPMPAGSGAMLTCKVPAKRPLPCIVIVIHGVNDDGQFFPVIDKHLCAGLNKRLGRDDLFPHKWGQWKDDSKGALSTRSRSASILEEGRSPVIPFYWGYRPVDRKTYQQDQRRYKAQLDAHNNDPDLPYSSYYRDRRGDLKAGWSCSDNLGNWLDDQFAKDGGPFAAATTNLVDMWGPGPGGTAYDVVAGAKRIFGESSSPMHPNPHRIYYVHAARRLADLIIRIRQDLHAGPDTINIIAHSQGTEITMLANFLVRDAKRRPVDGVILCNSPYGLDPTAGELTFPGRHQSRAARVQTLTEFAKMMWEKRRAVDPNRITETCVASSGTWAKIDHARDNAGHVYNYFCPQDQVASLPTIEGIGWQGVDEKAMKAILVEAPNFFQRVFSDGHMVGTGRETFDFGARENAAVAGALLPGSGNHDRRINGASLPEPYRFQTLTGSDKLGERLADTALAEEGPRKVLRIVDVHTGVESNPSVAYPWGTPANVTQAQERLSASGYSHRVLEAWHVGVPVISQQYLIRRHETKGESLSRLAQRQTPWTQHSAITLHHETIEKCMAYDLAIGLTVAFDERGGELWWELLQQADWRHPKNPDPQAREYFSSGILPPAIKLRMSKLDLPTGVVNEVVPGPSNAETGLPLPLGVDARTLPPRLPPLMAEERQWPLPRPNVEG